MKKFLFPLLLLSAFLIGCESTSNDSGNTGDEENYNPSLSMTVTANSLSEWPIRGAIKFAYQNGSNVGTDKGGAWNRFIGEATIARFQELGMTFVEQSEADYLVTSYLLGTDTESNKSLFGNMDPGVDTQQKGTIKLTIKDLLTQKPVWEGIIQAYSDLPIATASQKKFAAYSLINQVTYRLPKVE